MNYKRPKLGIFFGSFGSEDAFLKSIEDVYGKIVSKGSIYYVPHKQSKRLESHEIMDGMVLVNGLYVYPGLENVNDTPSSIAIAKERDGMIFHDFRDPIKLDEVFDYQAIKAMEAGYGEAGEDMIAVALSGLGSGRLIFLQEMRKRGTKLIIQDPTTAKATRMLNDFIMAARFARVSHEILPPKEIGYRVNEFFDQSL